MKSVRNPMDTSEKIGLYGLGALAAAGLLYYYMKVSKTSTKATALNIVSYRNKRTGTIMAAPATLTDVEKNDVVTVNVKYNFNGTQTSGAILEVATVEPGSGHLIEWVQSKITLTPSGDPQLASLDLPIKQMYSAGCGLAFSILMPKAHWYDYLEFWNEMGGTIHAPNIMTAIGKMTGVASPTKDTNVANVNFQPIAPLTASTIYKPGDVFNFNIVFDHTGSIPEYAYAYCELGTLVGKTFTPFDEVTGQTQQGNFNWPSTTKTTADNIIGPYDFIIPQDTDPAIQYFYIRVSFALTTASNAPNNLASGPSGQFISLGIPISLNPSGGGTGPGGNGGILPGILPWSVSPYDAGTIYAKPAPPYKNGQQITLEAIPVQGNQFGYWTINGIKANPKSGKGDGEYQDQNNNNFLDVTLKIESSGAIDTAIVAYFLGTAEGIGSTNPNPPPGPASISIAVQGSGVVNQTVIQQSDPSGLTAGDEISLEAVPDPDSIFAYYQDYSNNNFYQNPLVVILQAGVNQIKAMFQQYSCTLQVTTNVETDSSANCGMNVLGGYDNPAYESRSSMTIPWTPVYYPLGQKVTIAASADGVNYKFSGTFIVNNETVQATSMGSDSQGYLNLTLNGDTVVEAIFNVVNAQATLKVQLDPSNQEDVFVEITPSGVEVAGETNTYAFPANTVVTCQAYTTNPNQFVFSQWEINGIPFPPTATPQDNPIKFTLKSKYKVTIQAEFNTVPGGGGGGGGGQLPGGIFPAPGTVGDGQYWMYIVFLASYGGSGVWIGYNTYLDEYDPQDSSSDYDELASVHGPYASGATS